MKKYTALLLIAALLLTGCAAKTVDEPQETIPTVTQPTTQAEPTESNEVSSEDGMFTDRDMRTTYDESSAVYIPLSGSRVEITQEGIYVLSGTMTDGMVLVNADKTAKVQLVFNGVQITNRSGAALCVLQADKVFITLADGTQNYLSGGSSFTPIGDENVDATLYSKEDITINGTGKLTVTSPAGHGIVSKDDLKITGGFLKVEAASHGLKANDSVRFTGAELTVTAGMDGIHCENKDDASLGYVYVSGGAMNIQAEGDGISAGGSLHITGGSFDIVAGGGSENGTKESSGGWGGFPGGGRPGMPGPGQSSTTDDDSTSMKGIKAASNLQIDAGSFTINSADDAIHSNGSVTVNGGTFAIATGDDGIHGDENLTVNGGTIQITESYEGLEALHITIAGGDIDLVATDDGVNAAGGTDSSGTGGRDSMFGGMRPGGPGSSNGSIVISGGKLKINASGDGIDANGTLEISGGYTVVTGPIQGDTSTLDYDVSGIITGGTFIGTGSSSMAHSFSSAQQGVIAVSVGSQSAHTQITLTDSKGTVLFSHAPELPFQVVILSSPDLISGQTYTLTVGTVSGDFTA